MLDFSSSRSSSRSSSEAYDNRSMASESAIAAGGNRGIVSRYIAAPVHIEGPANFRKELLYIGVAAVVIWQFPVLRKWMKKTFKALS
jgi:hypothetical protein